MLSQLTRSLWFRLLAIFLGLGFLFIYGVTQALSYIYRADDLRDLVSAHLALHVDYVLDDIGDPPRIERARAITQRVPVDIRLVGPDLSWASDERFPTVDELTFGDSEYFGEEGAWLKRLQNAAFARSGNHVFLKLQRGDYAIVVSTPKMGDAKPTVDVSVVITGIGLASLLLGYLGVRWLFSPVAAIREGAARIGRGDFGHRIERTRHDELGELAADVNAMADDVEAMLDAKRALLIGISHELRSPLSRLLLSSEFVDDVAFRNELREEVSQMETIIEALMVAETLNSRHATLNREEVDIRDLLQDLVYQYFPRDTDRIELQVGDAPLMARVDPVRILLLMKNLIGNALRYGCPVGTKVTVSAASAGADLLMCVSDQGPGLTQAQKARFGEAFFRNEPSRDRASGGTGLGLYLSNIICKAHGGSLTVDPDYQHGARLIVRLPLSL